MESSKWQCCDLLLYLNTIITTNDTVTADAATDITTTTTIYTTITTTTTIYTTTPSWRGFANED